MHSVAHLSAARCKHKCEYSQKHEALQWLISQTWPQVLQPRGSSWAPAWRVSCFPNGNLCFNKLGL